jgi:hypothetical protein
MRKSILAFGVCLAFAGFATAVGAEERVYDNGPVWDVASVQTKPGHFNDYMKFISTTWRAEQEMLKKEGYVLDYKVFVVVDQRDNEPDVTLAVEYKDMAAYDLPLDKQDAMTKQMFGSMMGGDKSAIDRETYRTLRGDTLLRELVFKK